MKIINGGLLLLFLLPIIPQKFVYIAPPIELITVQEVSAHEEVIKKTIWTKEEIVKIAENKANKYNISREQMVRVTLCEAPIYNNVYNSEDSQSRLTYSEGQIARHPTWGVVGEREKSFGPAQIHLPAHPTISKEEASDPDFAIDFMAKKISEGKESWWMCK